MDLIRHDPTAWLNEVRSDLNRLFGAANGGSQEESNVVTSQWMPAVDIKEEPDRFVMYADVPGVDPKDIEVTMENGMLTIKGERLHEDKKEGERYTRFERSHGLFYRRFSLPDSADPDRIEAHGNHGVLQIVVPKQEKQQARRITVKS